MKQISLAAKPIKSMTQEDLGSYMSSVWNTTTMTATKTSLKKRICGASNFMALIPSLVQMGFHQGGHLWEVARRASTEVHCWLISGRTMPLDKGIECKIMKTSSDYFTAG